MAYSAFSFHCMICFEEFDPETNYPVVLPCGHTYVCVECANRLDKCMECRTPLTITIDAAPPPPPGMPGTPGTPGSPDVRRERSNYADRVRNSPGFQRRYGYQYNDINNNINNRGPSHALPAPAVKQRLPLPKNVVLLSLLQASEPARRRAEVDAPNTPQQTYYDSDAPQSGLETPSRPTTLPKFSKSSPLLFRGQSNGGRSLISESSTSDLQGSVPTDEAQKIRVGTYLEGGPCGTYAVAAKGGLLVYPTLFEHTLPSGMRGFRLEDEDAIKREVDELVKKHRATMGNPSFGNLATLSVAASYESDDEMRELVSLTISEDDLADETSNRILPVRRAHSIHGASAPHSMTPFPDITDDSPPRAERNTTNKFSRHFSQGLYPNPKPKKSKSPVGNEDATDDEFDRPLIRLRYGDRVQVVSMDGRGWVKLARGYGYIRFENDKQLVKVGGTSDKACQIEAMLHELSMERSRIKKEQTKLERLSAGLMIDLQSSLLNSDDGQVVVSAPKVSLSRIDSESHLSLIVTSTSSHNEIDTSNRRRTISSPQSAIECSSCSPTNRQDHAHRVIRATQSYSPGNACVGQVASNARGSVSSTSNSPMRVNFRTGRSGHRALMSAHSHPHDFIEHQRAQGAAIRSMSNHAGVSLNPMNGYNFPDAFWESPCTSNC